MPFVIIEGSQNAGKTMLAGEVVRALEDIGVSPFYYHTVKDECNIYKLLTLVKEIEEANEYWVIDRWYLSNYVYSLLLDRDVEIAAGELDAIRLMDNIVDRSGVRIVLTPDPVTLAVRSCLLYTSPSPRDRQKSRMPSSA